MSVVKTGNLAIVSGDITFSTTPYQGQMTIVTMPYKPLEIQNFAVTGEPSGQSTFGYVQTDSSMKFNAYGLASGRYRFGFNYVIEAT